MIFLHEGSWMRTLIHCDSSQKRDPKPCLRRKILTFATGTLFSWNFFVWKMSITGRYCEQNFVSGVARRSGTRSKIKWRWYILTMLLCFSYQVGKTLYNSRYHLKTSLGCVSIQQKTFRGKIFVFHRDMIFLLEGSWMKTLIHCDSSKRETQNHVSGEKF